MSTSSKKMPLQVWILTLSAFAIGTAEFVIAGILTQVAESLGVSEGQAGHLITAYAMAIVIGGPVLTLWLARFDKRRVLIGLMGLFIAGNLLGAFTHDYTALLISRVIAGLTQGPFYGIGAVVAMRLVPEKMAGRAVGQMFAGLTLANEPMAERVAGFDRSALTGVLVVVGLGLVIGNSLGGRTADRNLRLSLIGWPIAMIGSLLLAGLVAPHKWAFLSASFGFGIASFANVPPLQMRVMKHGGDAPELAATANISAFNIANALGGVIGGLVVDSHFGAGAIPFAAALVPAIGLLFILSQERVGRSVARPVESPAAS